MFLYLVSRPTNAGTDRYQSFVCAARSSDAAREMFPMPISHFDVGCPHQIWTPDYANDDWVSPGCPIHCSDYDPLDLWVAPSRLETLKVVKIGMCDPRLEGYTIHTSFNRGI